MLLLQIANLAHLAQPGYVGTPFVLADTPAEIGRVLRALDLRRQDAMMRSLGLACIPIPRQALLPLVERAKRHGPRDTADAIGRVYGGRYPFSVQVGAEIAQTVHEGVAVLRRYEPAETFAFRSAPRDGRQVLVDVGRWDLGYWQSDLLDPERRKNGWVTDNRWEASDPHPADIWPPRRYAPVPPIPPGFAGLFGLPTPALSKPRRSRSRQAAGDRPDAAA